MPDNIVSNCINHYEQQYYHPCYLRVSKKLIAEFTPCNHFVQQKHNVSSIKRRYR